jgi:hypothetical protein
VLKNDRRAIFTAAAHAQKAVITCTVCNRWLGVGRDLLLVDAEQSVELFFR